MIDDEYEVNNEFEKEDFDNDEFNEEVNKEMDDEFDNENYVFNEDDTNQEKENILQSSTTKTNYDSKTDLSLFKQYANSSRFEKDMNLLESNIDYFSERIHLHYILEQSIKTPINNFDTKDFLALRRCENALQKNIQFIENYIDSNIEDLHNTIKHTDNLETKLKTFDDLSTIAGLAQNFGVETIQRKKSIDSLFETFKKTFPQNDLSLIDSYAKIGEDNQDEIHLLMYSSANKKTLNKYKSWFSNLFFNKNNEKQEKQIIIENHDESSNEYDSSNEYQQQKTKIVRKTPFLSKLFWMGIGAGVATLASMYTINQYQNITEKANEGFQKIINENKTYEQMIHDNVLVPKTTVETDTAVLYKTTDGYVVQPLSKEKHVDELYIKKDLVKEQPIKIFEKEGQYYYELIK